MTPIGILLRVELIKLIRRPMTWTLSIILVIMTGFTYLSMIIALLAPESAGIDTVTLQKQVLLPDGLYFAAGIGSSLTTIMIIILAAGSVGSEFSWATVRSSLLMGATRVRFLVAKLLALEIFAVAWIIITILLGLLGAVITAVVTDNPVGASYLTSATFAGDLGMVLFHQVIVLAVWTIIATAITVITGSLAAGIGVTLVTMLLGSTVASVVAHIGSIGKWVARAFPNRALDSILALDSTTPPSYLTSDWVWIVLNIVIWTAIFSFLALRRFQRMNLIGNS